MKTNLPSLLRSLLFLLPIIAVVGCGSSNASKTDAASSATAVPSVNQKPSTHMPAEMRNAAESRGANLGGQPSAGQ